MKTIGVIDLFCGAGGLTYGLKKSGLDVSVGIDIDSSCKFAYEYNNSVPFICKSVADITENDLEEYFNYDIKILVGCAPCQPFSSQTFKYKASENHKDRELLDEFLRLIKETNPHIVSMENVPAITKQPIFDKFIKSLDDLGYKVDHNYIFCPRYGIPQNRRRLVLLASRLGEIKIIPPTHTPNNYVTVQETIGHLPPIKAGETHPNDFMHKSCSLSDLNLKRMQNSRQGGTWKDWDEALLPNCYRKATGKGYTGVYGRASWDKQSATITTQFPLYGSGRFGHPEQDRAFSLREGALLQTFPEDYQFIQNTTSGSLTSIKRQIGNAVPPKLGQVIGDSIIKHLKELDYV